MVRTAEVLIVGGGPAGAAAARLLALWGHSVRLITRPASPYAPVLAESLPPSCAKLFAVLGIADAIEREGFVRSTGNTVWWGDGEGRQELFAGGQRGWQVTAAALAQVLLNAAHDAGVSIQEARVTAEYVAAAEESVVLDCTGRAGLIARARRWRVQEPVLKSVALVAGWRPDVAWRLDDNTHTLIESYSDGWLWSVPSATGVRFIAAMVDPRSSSLAGDAAREIYLSEIAKAPRFSALVAQARCEAGPWGFDASMYAASRYADERVLLVGDAASFIDPLSSAGVKKALASGWLAAVAAHTALAHPRMRRIAFDFFAAREQEMYESFRTLTRQYLADAAGAHAHPFWTDRGLSDRPAGDEVSAAFGRLKASSELRLGRGEITIEHRASVSGCEIVLERRLAHPNTPHGVRYLHDTDVVRLVELATSYRDVGELFDAYTREAGPVDLHGFLLALATAIARGWLVWV